MLEALGRASDRGAALLHFVESVPPEEAALLRRALREDATLRDLQEGGPA